MSQFPISGKKNISEKSKIKYLLIIIWVHKKSSKPKLQKNLLLKHKKISRATLFILFNLDICSTISTFCGCSI